MITAEVPVRNEENFPIEFSVYDQVIDPAGSVAAATESLYRLGPGVEETILDELLRVKEPQGGLAGYRLRVLLRVGEEIIETKEVEIVCV